eukprot:CAMPEP_0172444520 /NCGR_PEP_ID=MMETSP1065-20121228/4543_1 /TAXON_ID=265537 /ORGANISM="Amphiprora paludosa, Strain CCMP125" /LENGTH=77 /DNA_ID=CAMNT_0013195075 /DNA_START=100 /DNA_END=333 /DNA_ORIENTATION=-
MKTTISILLLLVASVSAFTVSVPSARQPISAIFVSEPAEEEEGGLDLDLGEMFEMFEAADKDQSFDDAIKKVKSEDA